MRILLAAVNTPKGRPDGNLARHLAVPVARTTQAGSTEDEDFPGRAALVSPAGEVARLPNWRPGSLVVEVDADVTLRLGPWIGRRCVTFWLGGG